MQFSKEFKGVRAGEIYPTTFKPGDECPPELQDAAVSEGAVEQAAPKTTKAKQK